MNQPLSPAAQAVLDAYEGSGILRGPSLAAVLRAAADKVVPKEAWLKTEETCYAYYRQRCNTRRELLTIAAELDGTNPTNQEDYEV